MDPRTRAAQKRPLTHSAEWESDESESNSSDAPPDNVWAPSPVASDLDTTHIPLEPVSCSDPPESTSSTSEGGSSVRALALAPTKVAFPSWEVVEDYLAVYQAQTFQIFRARTNTTVAERNARIDRTKSKAEKLPDEWMQYAKTFVCTHSGKFKSQAMSKRPRQESRMKGCNAQINACDQVVDSEKMIFAVRITRCRLEHNNHWCGIMVDVERTEAIVYDPMASTYMIGVRALTEKIVTQLPNFAPRKYRVSPPIVEI